MKNRTLFSQESLNMIDSNQRMVRAKRQYPFRLFISNLVDREFSIHDELELVYMVRGNMDIRTKDRSHLINEDDFFIINSNQVHELRPRSEDCTVIVLQIDREFIEEKYGIPRNVLFDNSLLLEREELKSIIIAIFLDTFTEDMEINYSLKLLDILIAKLEVAQIEEYYSFLDLATVDDIVYDIVTRFSKGEIDININLQDLADEYNISYAYLSRKFKSIIGMNITEYIRTLKINRSLDYLINTDKTISEISNLSSFTDVKSMNRDFRKDLNMSPSQVRKKYRNRNREIEDKIKNNEGYFKELKEKAKKYEKHLISSQDDCLDIDLNNDHEYWLENKRIIDSLGVCRYEDVHRNLEELECRFLAVKIAYNDSSFQIYKRRNYLEDINSYEFCKNMESLMKKNLTLIIRLDFIGNNLEKIKKDSSVFFKQVFEDFKNIIHSHAMVMGISVIEKWRLQFDISAIRYLENKERLECKKFLEKVIKYIENRAGMEKIQWGLELGNISVEEKDFWFEDFSFLRDEDLLPDYYMLDLEYEHKRQTFCDLDHNIVNSINNSIDKLKYSLNISKSDSLWIDLNYRINNKEFKVKSDLVYYNILLNLVFSKLYNNKKYIKSYRIEDYGDKDIKVYNLCASMSNIKLTSSYINKFIKQFDGEIVKVGDNYIVSKSGRDVYILLYGILKGNHIQEQKLDSSISSKFKKKIDINFKGMEGKYKFTEFRIDSESSCFYTRFIEETGLIVLNSEEKAYVESRTFPKMNVFIDELEENYNYELTYEPLEIIFIKGQKI